MDDRYYTYINSSFIRVMITKKRLRHYQVAKAIGTTPKYWSQMLNHSRRPGPEMSDRILKFFGGKSWDDIFSMTSCSERP